MTRNILHISKTELLTSWVPGERVMRGGDHTAHGWKRSYRHHY